MRKTKPKVTVLYHYFYPDDVVSARHYEDFCKELSVRGWQVKAMPCNRGCRDESKSYRRFEIWRNIQIKRIWRPPFRQASTFGRLLNAMWMTTAWSLKALMSRNNPDVLIIGSDPMFSVIVARLWKFFRPRVSIAHWCYDLYPEVGIAEGILKEDSLFVQMIRGMLTSAYNACDIIVDLGVCMRRLLDEYCHSARKITLVPWALFEPEHVVEIDLEARKNLFGSSQLALMYSGNFGRAHSYEDILQLARMLRGESIHFSFGIRGNCANEVYNALSGDDTNITYSGFVSESELPKRLAAADIHLVSLKKSWTGVVVPSKFFGSLAVGRPVIFAGSRDAAISKWIEEYKIGWVLDQDSIPFVAQELKELLKSKEKLGQINQRCHEVYQSHFSKRKTMNSWDTELRALLDI